MNNSIQWSPSLLLNSSCSFIEKKLDQNPSFYKAVLVGNHFFRAGAMSTMMQSLPFSPAVSCAVSLAPSLLYRASIERFCIFRFALPSFAGGVALWAGRAAIVSILAKTAFASAGSLFTASLGLVTLAGYTVFVCRQASADIDQYMKRFGKVSCCGG